MTASERPSGESPALTRTQSNALMLLRNHEKLLHHDLEPGDAGVYSETWYDRHTVGIHWRTALALAHRGLVTIDAAGILPEEPADLFLTDLGRQVADA